VFVELWKKAGEVLRNANEVFIIGYSLPEADSAALTLLLTSCSRKKVRVVNSNKGVNVRLNRLLAQTVWKPEISFKKWLDEMSDCAD
jgi:hypothetical protein